MVLPVFRTVQNYGTAGV